MLGQVSFLDAADAFDSLQVLKGIKEADDSGILSW